MKPYRHLGEIMRTEQGKIEGDLRLEDSLTFLGTVTGDIHVSSSGFLKLKGVCGGDLSLEVGGEGLVYGVVAGNVDNRGGKLTIYGVVNGDITTSGGETNVEPNAVIGGRVFSAAFSILAAAIAPQLLESLIRKHLFMSIFRAISESLASEHAARLAAMQSAEKSIDERIQKYRLLFHQQRQAAIIKELLDVVSGFEAISRDIR
jgi:hypothetical protein